MYIRQKKIKKVETHTQSMVVGQTVVPAVPIDELTDGRLARCGLSDPPVAGESVVPTVVGTTEASATRFNVEGRNLIDRSERESYWQTFEWTHQEFRGQNPPEEVTNFASIERWRYRRVPIPAPGERFEVREDADGRLWVATTPRTLVEKNHGHLVHQVNLLLESFGFCILLDGQLTTPHKVSRVDWEFLPQGQMPWESGLHPKIQEIISGSPRNRGWHQYRIDTVASFQPDFTAVGRGGMRGYVLFNFPSQGVHVLECGRYGNATYVIDATHGWDEVTHLSKAELLNGGYVSRRIVHHASTWNGEVAALLGSN